MNYETTQYSTLKCRSCRKASRYSSKWSLITNSRIPCLGSPSGTMESHTDQPSFEIFPLDRNNPIRKLRGLNADLRLNWSDMRVYYPLSQLTLTLIRVSNFDLAEAINPHQSLLICWPMKNEFPQLFFFPSGLIAWAKKLRPGKKNRPSDEQTKQKLEPTLRASKPEMASLSTFEFELVGVGGPLKNPRKCLYWRPWALYVLWCIWPQILWQKKPPKEWIEFPSLGMTWSTSRPTSLRIIHIINRDN